MKLDDNAIRDTLTKIHAGPLTAAEAAAAIDVARHAASVDGRMDLSEMATVARVSKLLYAIAGVPNAPVPATPLGPGWLDEIGSRLRTTGPREVAYAVARLIVLVDRKVTDEETQLGQVLREALQISATRASELDSLVAALPR